MEDKSRGGVCRDKAKDTKDGQPTQKPGAVWNKVSHCRGSRQPHPHLDLRLGASRTGSEGEKSVALLRVGPPAQDIS